MVAAMRRKGEHSKATIEREFPHAVVIRVPPAGLRQLAELHREAEACGPYRAISRLAALTDAVRFGFTTPEAAAAFRVRAAAQCGDLVEPA